MVNLYTIKFSKYAEKVKLKQKNSNFDKKRRCILKVKILYRVTYNDKGIYDELKKAVGRDIWLQLLSLKEINWLPKPPMYAAENRSYFTQEGFEKFKNETLPIICQYLDEKYIKIETFEKVENIIYSDEYQVVVENI